jgi:glutathione peroxidase-family protein
MKQFIWTALIAVSFGTACSAEQEKEIKPTQFSVQFSVADSIDQTGDFSGFEVLVFSRENPNAAADTVFFGKTDSTGYIEGVIKLTNEGAFPAQVSRNGINLASFRVLLAGDDTVNISGEFPEFQKTFEADSREARAMKKFERVNSGFQRTSRFILSGQVADSLIGYELQKWVDLFWEVHQNEKGTFASKFALESTVDLLNRFDRLQMFEKLNQSFDEELAFGLAITLGKEFVADQRGFESAVAYLDSVKTLTKKREILRAIEQSVIKLHYDSLNVEDGRLLLEKYESKYVRRGEEPSVWYKNMRFELTYLAPGMTIPSFSIQTTAADTVTDQSLLGEVYVLEFTLMANSLYQQQYEEATVIYQLYNSQGLEYFTIPFDPSSNTIVAFFEERDRYWELADPPSFNKKDFVEDFNIQYFPTRILVDKEGKIVRKFVGEEFEDIIPFITETLK